MKRTFSYGKARITIHRATNADELDSELVASILCNALDDQTNRAYHRARRFADMLVSIDAVEGDAGLVIPAVEATGAELVEGYQAWLADAGLYRAWKTAAAEANGPVGDVDTSPAADPNVPAAQT